MNHLVFCIPIDPKSHQRGLRAGIKNGKAFVFKSKEKRNYEKLMASLLLQHRPAKPFLGPVKLDVIFVMPRPRSLAGKKFPKSFIAHTGRPDRDNLYKVFSDCLTRAGFWRDDSQVFDGRISKVYAEKNGAPRIEVALCELGEPRV